MCYEREKNFNRKARLQCMKQIMEDINYRTYEELKKKERSEDVRNYYMTGDI